MKIKNLGVIGSGTMGNGIAQVCAIAGLDVVMVDISDTAVEHGLATIRSSLERLVKKGSLTAENRGGTLARVKGTTSYDRLKGADLVIEAATERKDLKISI